MSGMARKYGKGLGITAVAAVMLSTISGGAAQASQVSDSFTGATTFHRTPAAGGGIGIAAEPEHIPSVCKITGYSPSTIVLGTTAKKTTFKVSVTGCTVNAWYLEVGPFVNGVPASLVGRAGDNIWFYEDNAAGEQVKVTPKPTISLAPRSLRNDDAGKWTPGVYALAYGNEDPADTEELVVDPAEVLKPLTLKRQATFGKTFNATPEPVKKGKKLTLKATLSRVNWNGAKTLKYVGFNGKAQVQFKAAGATTYKTVKTVQATTKGKISTTVKATKSGSWRLVYAGVSTTAPATSVADAVKVK